MPVKFALSTQKRYPGSHSLENQNGLYLNGVSNGATVILIHGLTGTPNEMKYIANSFHKKGYNVSCPRLANHGEPLHILKKTKWQQCYDSVRQDFLRIKKSNPQETIFVAGLSMGALLALLLAQEFQDQIAAVSCLSPTLFYDGWNAPWSRHLLPLAYFTPLKHFFYFKEEPPYGIKNQSIRQRVHKYFNNASLYDTASVAQFGYPYFPVSLLWELQLLVKHLTKKLQFINIPVQIIQAKEDDMTSIKNAQFIYDKISSKIKEIVLLENSYHIITADQERAKVARKMHEFFKKMEGGLYTHIPMNHLTDPNLLRPPSTKGWHERKTKWGSIMFFSVLTAVTFIGAPIYIRFRGISISETVLFVFYVLATSFAITVGYHRLFAHSSFKVHSLIRFLVLFFGAAAFEQSALKWSSLHRTHHQYVDTELDPYNIKNGFFYAHVGWILFWKHPTNYENVRDLQQSRLVMHQHKHYKAWSFAAGLALPLVIGALSGHVLGALLFGVAARLVFVFNSAFFINSFAHTFGSKPFDTRSSAKDNWLGAILTNGEGYHNFHHRFPTDYRNGFRWYHWDPSKWLIRALAYMRLASNLKITSTPMIYRARLKTSQQALHI